MDILSFFISRAKMRAERNAKEFCFRLIFGSISRGRSRASRPQEPHLGDFALSVGDGSGGAFSAHEMFHCCSHF